MAERWRGPATHGHALWRAMPDWLEPMRPAPVEPRAVAGSWRWEPLLEGTRCLTWVDQTGIRMLSTRRERIERMAPQLSATLRQQIRGHAVLDGVISERRLQVFDCLHYEGADLTPLPYLDRRAVLEDIVLTGERLRLVPSHDSVESLVSDGLAAGGVVAKRESSPYSAGLSTDWLAIDCIRRDDFVVGGFVVEQGSSSPAALLVGHYENGWLRYAGKVTQSYDPRGFESLTRTLSRLGRRTTPFGGLVPEGAGIHWVSPALVVRVGFAHWSDGGLLRRARYVGLRHDRDADEVRRGQPRRRKVEG